MNILRKEPRCIRRRFPYLEPAPDVAARASGAGALRDESFCLPEDRPQHGDHAVVQLFGLSFDFCDHEYSHLSISLIATLARQRLAVVSEW